MPATQIGGLFFLSFDRLVANRIPTRSGPVQLVHALNTRGGVLSEFTAWREGANSFYLVSAGAFQRMDHDWIRRHAPRDGSVCIENLTNQLGVLVVAGPTARELMTRVTDADLSSAAFPWLTGRWTDVGLAPCLALRVNYVGELGWELHHPIEYQNHIFDALMEAGEDLGLAPFGMRAMDSMRFEKSYRMVGTELSIEYAALESELRRFVHLNKGDFIGRDALQRWMERGFSTRLVTIGRIDDSSMKEGDCPSSRPRGTSWAAYFDSDTRGSLPERRQPPLDERDEMRRRPTDVRSDSFRRLSPERN